MMKKAIGLLIFIASVGAIIWGLGYGPVIGDVPMTPPPTPAVTTPTPTVSQSMPTPTRPPLVTSITPTVEPTPAPETSSPPVMSDIDSSPVHIEVRRDDEVLISTNVQSIQMNAKGELNPASGSAGWYGPPQWSTIPGNLSDYPAVIVGHVTYSSRPDVFYRLAEVRTGDTVVVTYQSGDAAVFVIDGSPVSASKNDVIDKAETEYVWAWRLDEPGRKVTLFTCDPSQGRDGSGHSLNNWVVQATRVQ